MGGTSGSGKTTLARAIGIALELPHTEIDSLFHGPGWTERPEFGADVERLAAQPAWVTEWQYERARAVLKPLADTVVWLDLPTWLVMSQLTRRTLRRWLRHEPLWNENVEQPIWRIAVDPDHIIRWAWRTRGSACDRVLATAAERPDLVVVRLRSRSEVARWLAGPLCEAASSPA